jgi:hypothetical protein
LLRKSASELLRHPWLKNPRNHLDRVGGHSSFLHPRRPCGQLSTHRRATWVKQVKQHSVQLPHGPVRAEELEGAREAAAAVQSEESVVNTIRMYAKAQGDRRGSGR